MIGLGAAAAGGAIQGGLGIINGVIQGEYNKAIQQKAHENALELQSEANKFTEKQSQNQIKYNVDQMRELGLSPLMLFDHASATGGGAGGGSTGRGASGASAPDYLTGIINGINTVGRMMLENEKNNLEERRIDLYEKEINQRDNDYESKMGARHKYTQKDFKRVFDDLDKVEI